MTGQGALVLGALLGLELWQTKCCVNASKINLVSEGGVEVISSTSMSISSYMPVISSIIPRCLYHVKTL